MTTSAITLYQNSLEDRIELQENLRIEQAKALALASDLSLLHSEVAALKQIMLDFGLPRKPTAEELVAVNHSGDRSNCTEYAQLSPHDRHAIDQGVKSFLEQNLTSREQVSQCRVALTKSGNLSTSSKYSTASKLYYALPKALVDDFKDWIDVKLYDLIEAEGTGDVGNGPAGMEESGGSQEGDEDDDRTYFSSQQQQQQQQQHRKSSASSSTSLASTTSLYMTDSSGLNDLPTEIVTDLHFPTVAPALLPNGAPNVEQFRAWTDIIRARYKTFQRATPPMSKHARLFLQNKKLPVFCLVPGSSVRISKATFAIPGALHDAFLKYMEDAFFKNGVFGEKSLHSATPRRIVGGGEGWEGLTAASPLAVFSSGGGSGCGGSPSMLGMLPVKKEDVANWTHVATTTTPASKLVVGGFGSREVRSVSPFPFDDSVELGVVLAELLGKRAAKAEALGVEEKRARVEPEEGGR
ncbi:hypothetical protein HDU98_009891 [Podochytrium sp. JEL0797]|nr:hypothetical protein HDU98_009891 [Podochytrium sp. JEL0797]